MISRNLTIVLFVLPCFLLSQSNFDSYIKGTFDKVIKQEQLKNITSMSDINPGFPTSWIGENEYVGSEIKIIDGADTLSIKGHNNVLNTAQKKSIQEAGIGSEINVIVRYKSNNNLEGKSTERDIIFSRFIIPYSEAKFPDGNKNLNAYLNEEIQNNIDSKYLGSVKMTTVTFTINENGKAINPHISPVPENPIIDKEIKNIMVNMPTWEAAEDSKGDKVKQKFEFVFGNMIGC